MKSPKITVSIFVLTGVFLATVTSAVAVPFFLDDRYENKVHAKEEISRVIVEMKEFRLEMNTRFDRIEGIANGSSP